MIKFSAETKKGKLLGLGISEENVRKLKEGRRREGGREGSSQIGRS